MVQTALFGNRFEAAWFTSLVHSADARGERPGQGVRGSVEKERPAPSWPSSRRAPLHSCFLIQRHKERWRSVPSCLTAARHHGSSGCSSLHSPGLAKSCQGAHLDGRPRLPPDSPLRICGSDTLFPSTTKTAQAMGAGWGVGLPRKESV